MEELKDRYELILRLIFDGDNDVEIGVLWVIPDMDFNGATICLSRYYALAFHQEKLYIPTNLLGSLNKIKEPRCVIDKWLKNFEKFKVYDIKTLIIKHDRY